MPRFLPSLFGNDGREPFQSLFREVERVFDDFSRRPLGLAPDLSAVSISPRIDVSESKDAVEVTAELPGVEEKDIDVTVSDGVLTLKGEKKIERDEKGKDWHVVERSYGAFTRSIPLDFDPDAGKVEAKFENGVLKIRLPKPAEVVKKTQKIEIKAH